MKTLNLKDFLLEFKDWFRARYHHDPDVDNEFLIAMNMFMLRGYQEGLCLKPFQSWYNWDVLSKDYEYRQNNPKNTGVK